MGAKAREVCRLNRPIGYVVDKMRRIAGAKLKCQLLSENPDGHGGCWFSLCRNASLASWGENITVALYPVDGFTTDIDIHSECALPTQIIDYGKNKKNVETLFQYIVS